MQQEMFLCQYSSNGDYFYTTSSNRIHKFDSQDENFHKLTNYFTEQNLYLNIRNMELD
jgi:hypothetical protein